MGAVECTLLARLKIRLPISAPSRKLKMPGKQEVSFSLLQPNPGLIMPLSERSMTILAETFHYHRIGMADPLRVIIPIIAMPGQPAQPMGEELSSIQARSVGQSNPAMIFTRFLAVSRFGFTHHFIEKPAHIFWLTSPQILNPLLALTRNMLTD